MPRLQVYLPEELYAELKRRKLPASELLQDAVRAEIRRQDLSDAADLYLQELIAEVGEPTAEDLAWAEDFVTRLKTHQTSQVELDDPSSNASRPGASGSATEDHGRRAS